MIARNFGEKLVGTYSDACRETSFRAYQSFHHSPKGYRRVIAPDIVAMTHIKISLIDGNLLHLTAESRQQLHNMARFLSIGIHPRGDENAVRT